MSTSEIGSFGITRKGINYTEGVDNWIDSEKIEVLPGVFNVLGGTSLLATYCDVVPAAIHERMRREKIQGGTVPERMITRYSQRYKPLASGLFVQEITAEEFIPVTDREVEPITPTTETVITQFEALNDVERATCLNALQRVIDPNRIG